MLVFLFITVFLPMVVTVDVAADSAPQSCTMLRVAKEDKYYGLSDSSTTVSFNLQLFKFGKSTSWIQLSNVSWYDSNGRYPDYICSDVSYGINDPDPRQCSSSLDQPFAFYIQDPSFYLYAHFPGYWSEIFYGFADDGTFSYGDGSLFTTATPSYSYNRADKSSSESDTQTCTSFSSAPAATTKTPKCKTFESQTKIINSDNLETYSTSNGTFTFINDGKYINSTMNFAGPEDYFVLYHINGEACESKYKTCQSEILKVDQKIIISSSIVKQNGTELYGDGIPMIGRIILRGDQTLMKEGVPFTPTNNCMSSNYNFGSDRFSQNEFCCTEFENA